jgi:hypothetical protein
VHNFSPFRKLSAAIFDQTIRNLFILANRKKTCRAKFDDLVKSLEMRFFVIPAKAGIHPFQKLINTPDSGFQRTDGFLQSRSS